MPHLVKTSIHHSLLEDYSEFHYRVSQREMLAQHGNFIEREIVRIVSEELARDFILQHREKIFALVTPESICKAMTEAWINQQRTGR